MIERKEIQAFENLELLAKQAVEGFITGLHKSPYHGFSVEFAEHRLYNTGESTKHIDWKLYARTDKLFVKRYEEETNLRCRIVLDHSSSMYFPKLENPTLENPNKMLFSICCTAALMNLLKRQRDAVGLSVFSDEVELHTPERTTTQHHQLLLHELEKMWLNQPQQKSTFVVDALHEIAENIHKRSLVILFTDMMDNSERSDELFAALQHLKFNKHEVVLFHVMDKSKELDFNYENRPHKFVDLESGEEVKLTPKEIKGQYQQQSNTFLKEMKLKCAQYQIDLVEADINEGFHPVLLAYLLKREKLF
ncbi:MAG: DUF58 domain-containing protein [Bacteroidetes bacterium]|nr:DUF58 domain-containing protein [Bacteroidota bacterium]